MVRMNGGKAVEVRGWDWLSGNPALIARDHCNWRLMAIRSYENQGDRDLHYSSVITLAEEDVARIKHLILKSLETCREVIRESKEETVCSLLVDFFEL